MRYKNTFLIGTVIIAILVFVVLIYTKKDDCSENYKKETSENIHKKLNIAFWNNQLCERGTSLGLYNYAFYNEKLLGNKSFIFYEKNNKYNKKKIIQKFKKKFIVHGTHDFKDVDEYLLKYNITHIFIIKAGGLDSRLSKVAKNCIQCVFNCNHPHGEVYCSISPLVNGNNGQYPVIPRIINLPKHNKNMREKLNIPKNAVVFGGYGGRGSFDIKFVHKVVYNFAKNNKNIYFLFANFNKFCPELPNIIHLPMITELNEKVKFINTCDAMLWARSGGETFGQAIGEFSILNKPVIATKVGDLSHVYFLKDKAFWYTDEKDLTQILLNFEPEIESKKDWNAYRDYTPEKVMKTFKEVFLDKTKDKNLHNKFNISKLPHINEAEKQKIQKVNGLMSNKQYELIYQIIKSRSPCNLLVFGLGEDSYLWTSANNGGKTIFIENIKSWAERFPDLNTEIIKYNTTVLDFPNNLNADNLLLDLPDSIKDYIWDIIIIDSPVGHNPPCRKGTCNLCSPTNPAPGRMASIYTASKLVHNKSIIIVDDTNREIENKCTKLYIEPNFKLQFDDGKLQVLANEKDFAEILIQ